MKSLDGSAQGVVRATIEDCYALLADVARYPSWCEPIRAVEMLAHAGDGAQDRARVWLHIAQGPVRKDLEFEGTIRLAPPEAVVLRRVPDDGSDREELELDWRLQSDPPRTRVELRFHAVTRVVPGFVPLFGVGDAIAQLLLDGAVSAVTR